MPEQNKLNSIEKVAAKARKKLLKIPFALKDNMVSYICECGDLEVRYEVHSDGYYQVINERGKVCEEKLADSVTEIIDYFVNEAVKHYAFDYERQHRRKFESKLRQTHEIMERCYSYIDPSRKFILNSYNDTIHIYLDLIEYYQKTAMDYLAFHYKISNANLREELEFLGNRLYCKESGGMADVAFNFTVIRYYVKKVSTKDHTLKEKLGMHENECGRLYELEAKYPDSPDSYLLGTLDAVVDEAEEYVKLIYEGRYFPLENIQVQDVKTYIVRRLIMMVYTERNLGKDVEHLLNTMEILGACGREIELMELFITRKYGVFSEFKKGSMEKRDEAIKRLQEMNIMVYKL